MAEFTHVATFAGDALPYGTGIVDLAIHARAGGLFLHAGNGRLGGMMQFSLSAGAAANLIDSQGYGPGMFALAPTRLFFLDQGNDSWILPLGRQDQGLGGYALSVDGGFGAAADFSTGHGDLGTAVSVDVFGQHMVYGGHRGAGGISRFTVQAGGQLTAGETIADTALSYAADSVAMATITLDGQPYVFSASALENGLSGYRVKADGKLVLASGVGADQGLGIASPTALETASLGSDNFLILAAAGSSSLSVVRVLADGGLLVTDHILDDLHTRFQHVTALDVVRIGARIFVLAGGADDGMSLFTLLPGGRLLHLASIADSPDTTLANITAIAAAELAGTIQVFASGETEPGISQFSIDPGPAGLVLEGDSGVNTLTGQAGNDVLSGAGGNDVLDGRAGDDILMDGSGSDSLRGGSGADVFVFTKDGQTDHVLDYTPGTDRLDLSAFGMLHDVSQLTFQPTAQGVRIIFQNEVVEITSADGQPLSASDFTTRDVIDLSRPASGSVSYMQMITGGDGNDTLNGANGNDTIYGGNGDDDLTGGAGNDTIYGEGGNDTLIGGTGNDTLNGDAGADRLFGQVGFDTLHGGDGNDVLRGGDQADNLYGDAGADSLYGEAGNDRLFGGAGSDMLDGGTGNDALFGEAGVDTLQGGIGFDRLSGGDGNDTLYGGNQADNLWGGNGDDSLYGQIGNDRLFGGNGDDTQNGGDGNDALYGMTGSDLLVGGAGDDRLYGGAAYDTLIGGAGDDIMSGNFNWDTFVFADGFGNDTITDFDALNMFEKIDLSAVTGITDFNDLATNHMVQIRTDVMITDGADTITLLNVNLADLDASDFLF